MIKLREKIEVSTWVDGSGWSNTEIISGKIEEYTMTAQEMCENQDWSWWATEGFFSNWKKEKI